MSQIILELLDQLDTRIAVVGASDDPAKFGYAIYRDLKHKGFRVFAVNPNRATVDGDPSYASLKELQERPDIVNFVVPPEVTISVLRECLDLGLSNVWLQPGAESPEILNFLDEHRFHYLAQTCIMVQSRTRRG